MCTNLLYNICLIILYLLTEFTYTKCSLLSRVKNPVEHILKTTAESTVAQPKNIFRHEPYRVHRTLWRPTPAKTVLTAEDSSTSTVRRTGGWVHLQTRPEEEVKHAKVMPKKSYWHHFDENEAAWPKVVLILSSTERTTTQITIKKTFPSYFPQINYRTTENAASDYQNDTRENVAIVEPNIDWIPVNFETNGDKFVHPEEEDETQEAEDYIDVASVTTSMTTSVSTSMTTSMTTNLTTSMTTNLKTSMTKIMTTKVTKRRTLPLIMSGIILRNGTSNKPNEYTKCYQCGLTNVSEIPIVATCYQILGGSERKNMLTRRHYQVTCGGTGPNSFDPAPGVLYKGGCFKRFLDVGITYDERGCRTMPPQMGQSFMSKRMTQLEKTLHSFEEGCVSSPYASLTPFSRAISLWARYHVCVCVGKYCNRGEVLHTNSSFILIFLSILLNICKTYKPFGVS